MASALLESPLENGTDLNSVGTASAHSSELPTVGESESWIARLEPFCRRLARRYGSSPELRQDLRGELYLSLCQFLNDYDTSRGVPLDAYLHARLRSTAFTYARSEWRREARELAASRLAADEVGDGLADGWARLEAEPDRGFADRVHLRQSLLRAMDCLSPRQRTAIYLRYFQQCEYEEIGDALGIQAVTVRSLVRHGLRHLRKTLRGDRRASRNPARTSGQPLEDWRTTDMAA